MGNYDPSKSRLRRGSNSATSIRQRNISEATAVSNKNGPDTRQLMSNSGPSSASCPPTKIGDSNFAFENEDWNNGEGYNSSNEAKNTIENASAQSTLVSNVITTSVSNKSDCKVSLTFSYLFRVQIHRTPVHPWLTC